MKYKIRRASNEDINYPNIKEVKALEFSGNKVYEIEIRNLEDLIKLNKKFGELIINLEDEGHTDNNILIYDSYVE